MGIYAFRVAFKHLFELLKSKEGRKFLWLCFLRGDQNRNTPSQLHVRGRKIRYADNWSFLWQYYEIFHKGYYRFRSTGSQPVIFDCGANIGLATLFFISEYPGCRLIAFEPDPEIASIYQENFLSNERVEFHQKAVWIHSEGIKLAQMGSDSGYISETGTLLAETVRLKEKLNAFERIDMLKMDIEGAETKVLADCEEELFRVQNLFVEYHDRRNDPQTLSEVLDILKRAGFCYTILNENAYVKQPLIRNSESNAPAGFHLQLNIFAYRNPSEG